MYNIYFLSSIVTFFLLLSPINAYSENKSVKVPQTVEDALTELLKATSPKAVLPPTSVLDTILHFISSDIQTTQPIKLTTRDYGKGILYKNTIQIPFSILIQYMLNTNVPGETIYPTSIRRNAWMNNSEIITKNTAFLNATLPPKETIFSKGTEYEEITPDISSGCYYSYTLDRLFILYNFNNRAVLFSIAFMPKKSSVGLRGVVINDKQWLYVYTPTVGTNLSMLTWAETYMYGSATVSIYAQRPNSNNTDLYMFRWTNAGWSGMNVVTHKHITDGVSRFVTGLKQVIESSNRPSVQKITEKNSTLKTLELPQLQKELMPFAEELSSAKNSELSNKIFQNVLKGGIYPTTLTKENAIAELLKLYIKNELKTK